MHKSFRISQATISALHSSQIWAASFDWNGKAGQMPGLVTRERKHQVSHVIGLEDNHIPLPANLL
jgi:hypothetical protein